jgi:uncharacterized protein
MKFNRDELDKLTSSRLDIDEDIEFDFQSLYNPNRLIAIREVFAVGSVYYNKYTTQLITDLTVSGIMTVPCAITLEPFDIEFDTKIGEVFFFEESEETMDETFELVEEDELDMMPYIMGAIITEVPLKAINPNLKEYPKGNGWQVMTEEEYTKMKSQEIDPRLAKLKDFKFEE